MRPRSVALAGLMGAGKSTLGPPLAQRLGLAFVDVDHEIERRRGKSVAALFRDEGEAAFRAEEREVCLALAKEPGLVVALGGGALVDAATRRAVLDEGTCVYLRADVRTLAARCRAAGQGTRPLLEGADLEQRLADLLAAREPVYRQAALQVDVDGVEPDVLVERVAERVLAEERLRSRGSRLLARHPLGTYPIWFGDGLCDDAGAALTAAGISPGPVLVVSQEAITPHAERVCAALAAAGHEVATHRLPPGEKAKSLEAVSLLYEACVAHGIARDRPLLAVGGGVVGDVTGFAAATFMRGVPFVQVPTTVLAMVDSSVGGKTGVDLAGGKNLVGAFHQPLAVLVDPSVLATLPATELRCGLAEAAKHALLADEGLLRALEQGAAIDTELLRRAVRVKVDVVQRDPHERGEREHLNLGHTFAHALERVSGYELAHGLAVSVGLRACVSLSRRLGLCDAALVARVHRCLDGLGLTSTAAPYRAEELLAAMATDKKVKGGKLRLVLLAGLGEPVVVAAPDASAVLEAWRSVGAT